MRNLVIAAVIVSVLAGSSYGLINVRLTVDTFAIPIGGSTTVRVWGQGDAAGLFSLAGSVVSTGTATMSANADSGNWASTFSPTFGLTANKGAPGANGGWSNFGSQQTNYLTPDATFAKVGYVDLFDYTVTLVSSGFICLTFTPGTVGGYKPAETNKSVTIGTIIPVCEPEPATLALLALGGLLLARRRRV